MAYTTINKSTDYFNTKLYSGTGAIQTVSGVGFEPSWIWTKSRTNAGNNQVTDQVRGLTKYIRPNASNAEDTKTNAITAVNSDGFVLGADSSNDINASGQTYASWNWKANGQGSSNTNGSINTLYTSANTVSGFSISTYTGVGDVGSRTFGHGLTKAPEIVMIKNLSANENWVVGSNYTHPTLPWKYKLSLDNNGARAESGAYFADTAPTNSLVTIEGNAGVNGSGNTLVAYCFHSVSGFSKMGSYTGNGNANGAFIYTGFKPAFVMIKRYDSGTLDWNIYDSKRPAFNETNKPLWANTSDTQANVGTHGIDLLSNGFKIRTSNDQLANNGGTFLYMCFAEAPLVGSNNVPATAR